MADTETISCTHCKQAHPALAKAPFPNPLGERIRTEICAPCWQQWLAHQNKLMNHYGLNTMEPEHRKILLDNLKAFLFNEGPMAEIDTSLQGTITHISK
jgi:Fe-S cluster biosynthesis and repair protein YggX